MYLNQRKWDGLRPSWDRLVLPKTLIFPTSSWSYSRSSSIPLLIQTTGYRRKTITNEQLILLNSLSHDVIPHFQIHLKKFISPENTKLNK